MPVPRETTTPPKNFRVNSARSVVSVETEKVVIETPELLSAEDKLRVISETLQAQDFSVEEKNELALILSDETILDIMEQA